MFRMFKKRENLHARNHLKNSTDLSYNSMEHVYNNTMSCHATLSSNSPSSLDFRREENMEVITVLLYVEEYSPRISFIEGDTLNMRLLETPLVDLFTLLLHMPELYCWRLKTRNRYHRWCYLKQLL